MYVPELQRRKIEAARRQRLRSVALDALAARSSATQLGGLLEEQTGLLNRAASDALFEEFDTDKSGCINAAELQVIYTCTCTANEQCSAWAFSPRHCLV